MKICQTLLHKEYDAENLCDVERDVYECWENCEGVARDNGFVTGHFRITVTYIQDDEE